MSVLMGPELYRGTRLTGLSLGLVCRNSGLRILSEAKVRKRKRKREERREYGGNKRIMKPLEKVCFIYASYSHRGRE